MNLLRLILRNLLFFRGASLAVVAGMAVATSVLTGALMVGDSVKRSLAALALERLGPTDYALVGNRLFDDSPANSLARRVAAGAPAAGRYEVHSALILNGGVSSGEGEQKHRAGDVQILAAEGDWVPVKPGDCLVNGALFDALNVDKLANLAFTFPSLEESPRDAAVSRRDRTDSVAGLTVQAAQRITGRGMPDLFSLSGGQRTPRNAWVNLIDLQQAANQPGRANVLLVHDRQGKSDTAGAAALNDALKQAIGLSDYGLDVVRAGTSDEAMLVSRATYLDATTVAAADKVAGDLGLKLRKVNVSLINLVAKLDPATTSPAATQPANAGLHYVIGAGVSALEDGPLAPDEIVFNQLTATQLGATVGDRIRLTFFRRDAAGELKELASDSAGVTFRVGRIIPMTGLGADRSLTPVFKGMTDAPSVSDWDAPKELGLTREKLKLAERDNDKYWKTYNAAPRLFVNIETARRLWGAAYGDLTSIRLPLAKQDEFRDRLRSELTPEKVGMSFRPIKAEQVAAAQEGGVNDFAMIYVSLKLLPDRGGRTAGGDAFPARG